MENLTISQEGIVIVLDCEVLEFFMTLNSEHESGGVLYGSKVNEKEEYVVSGWTLPQKNDTFSAVSFCRNDKKHFDLINKKWRDDKTTMYFGDWHFHPVNDVAPSNQDYSSFVKICKESKTSSRYMINIIAAKQELIIFVYHKKRMTKLFEYRYKYGEEHYEK